MNQRLARITIVAIAAGFFSLAVTSAFAADDDAKKIEAFLKQFDEVMAGKGEGGLFEGSGSCKMCHMVKKTGAAHKKWQAGPHAKAFESLLSEEGKKRGAAKSIEKPEEDPNCLKCHSPIAVVAKEFHGKKFKKEEGVGCEACHGSGAKHIELQKAARKAKTDPPPEAAAVFLKASDPVLRNALCERCHSENEWHDVKAHDMEKSWEEIAHPKPTE